MPTRQEYESILENTKDEAALTDEELQQRLDAYQGLSELPEERLPLINMDALRKALYDAIISNPTAHNNSAAAAVGSEYAASAIAAGQFNANQFADIIKERTGGLNHKQYGDFVGLGQALSGYGLVLQNYYNIQPNRKPVLAEDVKRVQGLFSARAAVKEKNKAIDSFITGLPDELKASREEYLTSERDLAVDELTRYAPRAFESLNARGLLFSGEPQDALDQRAVELGTGLENFQAQLEEEDNQFYFNAAYQKALKDDLMARDDYRQAIDTERGRVLQDRSNRFTANQSELDRQSQERLDRENYERQLYSQRVRADRQQSAERSKRTTDIISQVGQVAGQIGGAYLGGKAASSGSSSSQPSYSSSKVS